jgi:glutamate synthase (NADPH/NADH) small chain
MPDTTKKKQKQPRTPMPEQAPEVRRSNFQEVALGYDLDMAVAEAERCLQCKKPLCVAGCPVDVDIKGFIKHLQNRDVPSAYQAILSTNSLPAVCGRVCPQENQCEGACILGKKGEPVAIGRLERFVADYYAADDACQELSGKQECPMVRDDLKVACIGSGPASLTVAAYLSTKGIKVSMYEALHEPGGVLVYGIPEFRLPKAIVHREIDALRQNGVDIRTNWVGGRTMTVQDLFDMEYKAVFMGVGAGLPRFLGLPGENLIGVFSANEYLTRVNLGRAYAFPNQDTPVMRNRNVTVLGAGNVAMDAARTAMRLGADNVTIVYRRTREEMPARAEEIHHAVEEGVNLELLASPTEFMGDDEGNLRALKVQRMQLGEPDDSGRRRPVPVEGETFEIETDLSVIAVGTGPNKIMLEATPELDLNKWGYVQVNEETGETSIPNVFAGGDIVTGAATVILAMGAGRRAAKEIADRLL